MNRKNGVSLSGVLGHIPFALLATRPQGTDTDGFKVRSSGAALLAGCTAHSSKLQTCRRREFALCYVCGCYAVFESTGAALHPTPVYCCTQLYLLARCRDSARVQATRGQAMQYTGAAVLFELYPCANGVTGRPGDVETRSPLRKIVPQEKPAAPVVCVHAGTAASCAAHLRGWRRDTSRCCVRLEAQMYRGREFAPRAPFAAAQAIII
ncbi:hypothetical protein B0H13DRAFT_2318799 [Mycena leptocephala]|nr:hypothetical protein B0H13DRAFT_2318799 [Mycena leptocephala]